MAFLFLFWRLAAALALRKRLTLHHGLLAVALLVEPIRIVPRVLRRLGTCAAARLFLPLLQLLHDLLLLSLARKALPFALQPRMLPLALILRAACGLIGRLGLLIIRQRLIHHGRIRHCLRRKRRCLRRLLLRKLRRSCIRVRSVLYPAFIHGVCVFIQKILYVGKEFVYLTVQFLDVKAVSVVHKKAPFFWSITKSRVFCTFRPCFDILL